MTTLKLTQGTPITLNAYYVGVSSHGCHLVRLKMHKDMPENNGQLMLVDSSVINELELEAQPPTTISKPLHTTNKQSLPKKAANEHSMLLCQVVLGGF